ncbi:MAG: metallophosphoesterase [Candidatus Babeliales bacterium]
MITSYSRFYRIISIIVMLTGFHVLCRGALRPQAPTPDVNQPIMAIPIDPARALSVPVVATVIAPTGTMLADDGKTDSPEQPIADINWLTYIFTTACAAPNAERTGVNAHLIAPPPQNVHSALSCFSHRMKRDLINTHIVHTEAECDELPYAQKLLVNPGAQACFVGDIHGSIGALVRLMWIWRNIGLLDANFKVPENKYFIFLGDYADYGRYGQLVLYTLLNLKLHNWKNVFLLRGNHESSISLKYGFYDELEHIYGKDVTFNMWDEWNACFFNLLPFVLYLGINWHQSFIQCCHGGIEPGFNPKSFLCSPDMYHDLSGHFSDYEFDDGIMNAVEPDQSRQEALRKHLFDELVQRGVFTTFGESYDVHYKYAKTTNSGFLWSDMITNAAFDSNRVRGLGFVASEEIVDRISGACNICAYMRAHQHHAGVRIGDISPNDDATNGAARWYNVIGVMPIPQGVHSQQCGIPVANSVSFNGTLTLSVPDAQAALDTARTTNTPVAWQAFKNALPSFPLEHDDYFPIITFTTASEAGSINNQWDSFGLCTIAPVVRNSHIAIYEACAAMAPAPAIAQVVQQQQPQVNPRKRKEPCV